MNPVKALIIYYSNVCGSTERLCSSEVGSTELSFPHAFSSLDDLAVSSLSVLVVRSKCGDWAT